MTTFALNGSSVLQVTVHGPHRGSHSLLNFLPVELLPHKRSRTYPTLQYWHPMFFVLLVLCSSKGIQGFSTDSDTAPSAYTTEYDDYDDSSASALDNQCPSAPTADMEREIEISEEPWNLTLLAAIILAVGFTFGCYFGYRFSRWAIPPFAYPEVHVCRSLLDLHPNSIIIQQNRVRAKAHLDPNCQWLNNATTFRLKVCTPCLDTASMSVTAAPAVESID